MEKNNQDWFESLINDIVMSIVGGLACGQLPRLKDTIEGYIDGLEVYKELSSSPLIKVTAKDDTTITFLIRGEFSFFSGAATAFMRIEVQIKKKLIEKAGTLNVDIVDWITVIGDLNLSKEKLFEARLAFGYDERDGQGYFMGRGALKIIPAQFGVDLFLGGLDDRGAALGIKIESPVAIPLGSTGMGLKALGGDFAYNFVARLDYKGTPVPHPTAANYIDWAANTAIDKWKPGPRDKTAVGVGVRCDIVTMADQGRAIKLQDAGVAVLTPGPVFILGGEGYVLMGIATAKGYLAVDIDSASIAIGLAAAVLVPPKKGDLVKGSGQLDALFSFSDPSLWYIYFGRVETPVGVKVLKDIFTAGVFYMIDNSLMQFGGELSVGWDYKVWKLRLYALIGVAARAKIGWNPFLLGAYFKLWGEIGVEIWIIKLALKAYASAEGTIANPCVLKFEVGLTIDLPWFLPDIEFTTDVSFSDEEVQPPALSLVLADAERIANSSKVKLDKLGAIHPITGRQWLLGTEKAWPDLEIVVPFRCRLIDTTTSKVVVGPAVSSQNQGGYDVYHELSEVTLLDTINNKKVTVHGVWADSQGGETARLHLLGQDPYAWLTPHVTPGSSAGVSGKTAALQYFGHGPAESFTGERAFSEMFVKPDTSADLLTDFSPMLPTRVLASDKFRLRFATTYGKSIHVDAIKLYVISSERNPAKVKYVIGDTASAVPLAAQKVQSLYGEHILAVVTLPVGAAVDRVWLESASKAPLLVYGVYYTEKRKSVQAVGPKQVLVPGKYKLTVKGKSYGTHAELPKTATVPWEFSKDFQVVYPERLRPYIHYATLGDPRLFTKEGHDWNPTTYGYGFPHYRNYDGVIRFKVPYISRMFTGKDRMTLRLEYDDRNTQPLSVEEKVTAAANPDNASSALQATQNWVQANQLKKVNLYDQEVTFQKSLTKSGPVHLSIWYTPQGGVAFKLDEWTVYVSRFEDFEAHVTLAENTLTTTYDANGKTVHAVSKKLRAALNRRAARLYQGKRLNVHKPLMAGQYPAAIPKAFPEEYATVPDGWTLPAALAAHLQSLDAETGIRFARFAHDSGVYFGSGGSAGKQELAEVVAETTVEALVDSSGRSYALWLRTPEPVDWRRVKASMQVRHITRIGDSVLGYAGRQPLKLDVAILPSPDACSAFLVGSFANDYCLLPCGEYELTLTFDPYAAGLFKLRPKAGVSAPEKAVLKFMQPYGPDWPQLPTAGGYIDFVKPEALLRVYWVIPELLLKAEQGSLIPEDLEQLRAALHALPEEAGVEELHRVVEESRALYLRHPAEAGPPLEGEAASKWLRKLLAELAPVVKLTRAIEQEELAHLEAEK